MIRQLSLTRSHNWLLLHLSIDLQEHENSCKIDIMISKHRKNFERSKTAINILPYLFQPLQNILPGAITADFFQQAIRQAQEATTGNQVKSNNTKN